MQIKVILKLSIVLTGIAYLTSGKNSPPSPAVVAQSEAQSENSEAMQLLMESLEKSSSIERKEFATGNDSNGWPPIHSR